MATGHRTASAPELPWACAHHTVGTRPLSNWFRARAKEGPAGADRCACATPRQQLAPPPPSASCCGGPGRALTSRAVAGEAGVAKGVLHRHFAEFDAFLAGLAEDRIARIADEAAVLRERAGTGTVAGNLTGALTDAVLLGRRSDRRA